MTRLLLDANLSRRTEQFLERRFGFDVASLAARGLGHLRDRDVVALAIRESRTIETFDQGFGELYHSREHPRFGVIILRVENQTAANVNRILEAFFSTEHTSTPLERTLVAINETRVRIVDLD